MTYYSRPLLIALTLLAAVATATAQQPPAYNGPAPVQQPTYGQPPQAGGAAVPVSAPRGAIAGQPAPNGPVTPPSPPFVLNDVEQQFVAQTLQMWETESAKIKTFNANFHRLDYDDVWGPKGETPNVVSEGTLSYSKPDKGSFKIDKIKRWTKTDPQNPAPDAPGSHIEQKDEVGEHWVCDGKAIYEYNHREKQLVVTPIPEEMRGQAITDGPLPFLFGAQADKLLARYWIRPASSNPDQIWLEAYPRRQADAANYDKVEIILDRKTMQPVALKIHLPGGQQRHVYTFESPTINGKLESWFGGLFSAPRTPLGWKRVVVQETPLPPGPQAANHTEGVQR
jgi:TIGR03009 family protein